MSFPNELNYMNNACAQSNSQFHYKDLTSKNYEHRIKLDPEGEPKIDLRNYIPNHHLHQSIIKEFPDDKNAFEKADIEWDISDQVNKHKYQLLLQKEEFINKLCEDKNSEIRKDLNDRKEKLRIELTKLIRDTLIFSKKNNPMSAMLPESINDIVKNIKEDKNINLSMNSINLSHLSGTTSSSANKKRYESNEFLKMLGLDLVNLTPDNVKLDIWGHFLCVQHCYLCAWFMPTRLPQAVLKWGKWRIPAVLVGQARVETHQQKVRRGRRRLRILRHHVVFRRVRLPRGVNLIQQILRVQPAVLLPAHRVRPRRVQILALFVPALQQPIHHAYRTVATQYVV